MPAFTCEFAPEGASTRPIHVVASGDLEGWSAGCSDRGRAWIDAQSFTAALGSHLVLPGPDGTPGAVIAGYGTAQDRSRNRFALGPLATALPEGAYHFEGLSDPVALAEQSLGWLLSGYQFTRYAGSARKPALLRLAPGLEPARLVAMAEGEGLTRDLINTPSNDMGPAELEAAARALAEAHGASCAVTLDEDLLGGNFPMIHAVGRASDRRPRLIELRWGSTGPALTLVGKGVCFDTGGLNLKPGGSMGLMKKDMGGSATVLGLAHMIMAQQMSVRLRVLIPAVENAVSGSAFRPGDILTSKK